MAISGFLEQSAAVTVKVGPFVDDGDGNTDETALTIARADVRLAKNGGNLVQKTETTTLVHDEIGMYNCLLDATDTNTLGILTLVIHEAGALHVRHDYMIVTTQVYDSLFGTDKLQVDIAQVGNSATLPELSVGIPAAAPSLEAALMLMYMALRNKLDITETIKEVHNDAGTIIASKATTDAGSAYSEAKMISG